jgi:hypothetical protein
MLMKPMLALGGNAETGMIKDIGIVEKSSRFAAMN